MSVPLERQQCQAVFTTICGQYPQWLTIDEAKRGSIIRRMERSCLAKTIDQCVDDGVARSFTEKKFVERYSTNCARILANLNVKGLVGSTYLIDGLIAGTIDPMTICDLTSAQLNPAASEAERAEIDMRKAVELNKKISTQFRCKKCGENKTSYIESQTRSGDELSTISIQCQNCGFVWRLG